MIMGVIYVPEQFSVVVDGVGTNHLQVVGGIVCDGTVHGNGDINVQYDREYMEMFSGSFQLSKNLYILSWKEY